LGHHQLKSFLSSSTHVHFFRRPVYLTHNLFFLYQLTTNNEDTIRPIDPSAKMKFTIAAVLSLATFAMAAPSPQNAGRPVPNGTCCVANTSLKQDVCNVNGQSGRCVPSGANNCKYLSRETYRKDDVLMHLQAVHS
jgi:hypothetical protein